MNGNESPRHELNRKIVIRLGALKSSWTLLAEASGALSGEDLENRIFSGRALSHDVAANVGLTLSLAAEEIEVLTHNYALPSAVITSGFHRSLPVYGSCLEDILASYAPVIKALIDEQFGDGQLSSADFWFDVMREASPDGYRVKLTLSGRYIPYPSPATPPTPEPLTRHRCRLAHPRW